MQVHVELEGGMLPDRFGKHAPAADRPRGHGSARSFPFTASQIPDGAAALAWVFLDWDSIPVCGLPWIHWAAWTPVPQGCSELAVPEDASRLGMEGLVQGHNSGRAADGDGFMTGYTGPCPPDCDHDYTLMVMALDRRPDELADGFWANQLIAASRGHTMGRAYALLPSRV